MGNFPHTGTLLIEAIQDETKDSNIRTWLPYLFFDSEKGINWARYPWVDSVVEAMIGANEPLLDRGLFQQLQDAPAAWKAKPRYKTWLEAAQLPAAERGSFLLTGARQLPTAHGAAHRLSGDRKHASATPIDKDIHSDSIEKCATDLRKLVWKGGIAMAAVMIVPNGILLVAHLLQQRREQQGNARFLATIPEREIAALRKQHRGQGEQPVALIQNDFYFIRDGRIVLSRENGRRDVLPEVRDAVSLMPFDEKLVVKRKGGEVRMWNPVRREWSQLAE